MVLGGMALALSRLIDNSVVVLENIFRHFEMGADSVQASETGGKEVQLAVLAATCSTAIVFFPVVLLTGVSKYLFSALALAVVIALFCSYSTPATATGPARANRRPFEHLLHRYVHLRIVAPLRDYWCVRQTWIRCDQANEERIMVRFRIGGREAYNLIQREVESL